MMPAVSEQVQALKDNGVNEFLLWNAENEYTEGANYNPKKGSAKERDPEGVEQDTKQQDNKDDNKKIVLKRMGTAINNKKAR